VQQLHGCHAASDFRHNRFSVKLSPDSIVGWCRHLAGFFLATPGDLAGLHENAVRLFT
jgi:hypothetical protein